MKLCIKCEKEKNESEFYKNSIYKDGLSRMCKECYIEYSKNKYKNSNRFYLKLELQEISNFVDKKNNDYIVKDVIDFIRYINFSNINNTKELQYFYKNKCFKNLYDENVTLFELLECDFEQYNDNICEIKSRKGYGKILNKLVNKFDTTYPKERFYKWWFNATQQDLINLQKILDINNIPLKICYKNGGTFFLGVI